MFRDLLVNSVIKHAELQTLEKFLHSDHLTPSASKYHNKLWAQQDCNHKNHQWDHLSNLLHHINNKYQWNAPITNRVLILKSQVNYQSFLTTIRPLINRVIGLWRTGS
jgi:hypothetical protein